MSGGWHIPPGYWQNSNIDPDSWRQNSGGGPMRVPARSGNVRNGWSNWLSDPYFSRNVHAQTHVTNYERNRMQLFNQPQTSYQQPVIPRPLRKPILESPIMNEFAKQKLMENAHVPGLRTGLQLRDAMLRRKNARDQQEVRKTNTKSINLRCSVSSEKIELRWENPEPKENVKYQITSECVKTKAKTEVSKPQKSPFCELKVVAGESYKIDVSCYKTTNNALIAKWNREIRAEFSYSELKQLLQKCYNFIRRGTNFEAQMHEFCIVYRCKPKVYWDEIHHYFNDVMKKYIKDDNGQPGNLINSRINGLFFSARLLPDLTLPQFSPFGNVRMVINAFTILNPNRHSFYFADFYCNKNIHYVTIVLCVIDSETDRYCRDRLIKLNPFSNPFVKLVPPMDRYGQWRFYVNYTVWVELYYTEDIQLNVGQFSAIMATGAGTSKIGGLPNNKQCNVCNLYPTGRKLVPKERIEMDSGDSTMAAILKEDRLADAAVADVLCYLVDRIEERSLPAEELTAKLDVDLVMAVEKMNKAIGGEESKGGSLAQIAKNLNEFVAGFNCRRDALIQDVVKLKKQAENSEL